MRIWRRRRAARHEDIEFQHTERLSVGTYHVYHGPDRERALAFLRATPVREESVFYIVETPEGSFGRDFRTLFDERTQHVLEVAPRPLLPIPVPSATHCARCGVVVMPFEDPLPTVQGCIMPLVLKHDELVSTGKGWNCARCGTLICAICAGPPPVTADSHPRCGFCGKTATMHGADPEWKIVVTRDLTTRGPGA